MKGHFYKRGKKWTYVVDIGIDEQKGKRRQKTKGGFATKKEAQAAAAKLITEFETGSYLEPTKLTVKDFFLQYLESRKLNLREGTYYNYKKHIDNHTKVWIYPATKINRIATRAILWAATGYHETCHDSQCTPNYWYCS